MDDILKIAVGAFVGILVSAMVFYWIFGIAKLQHNIRFIGARLEEIESILRTNKSDNKPEQ